MADTVDRIDVARVVWWRRLVVAAALLVCGVTAVSRAQTGDRNDAQCDSIIASARVDSTPAALYVSVGRADDGFFSPEEAHSMAVGVATMFTPPRPLRLSVFSGAPQMRMIRRVGADTATELRAPKITGVYRFWLRSKVDSVKPVTVRSTLVRAFDSAATEAIVSAMSTRGLIEVSVEDSMLVEVRFSTDSSVNAIRMLSAIFPRMPVVDVVPRRDNPPAVFPESESHDSTNRGVVVLRFVVDRDGTPTLGTVELVRASSLEFARAALQALPEQRFTPATVRGCTVAQEVIYPFTFAPPDSVKVPARH